MKVFISWSGERSKLVAELLDNWIQCVIQVVKPWMSSKDIDRGALWFTEINEQLSNTGIGILCLTKENKNKPWILFEAGALAKGLSSGRVIPLLIDLQPTDLENPLAQFNAAFPDKSGIWELVRTINLSLKEAQLRPEILQKIFDTYWPQFEISFNRIIESSPDGDKVVARDENDIMLEVLSTVRNFDKRLRNMESYQIDNRFNFGNGVSGASGRSGYNSKSPIESTSGSFPYDNFESKIIIQNLTDLFKDKPNTSIFDVRTLVIQELNAFGHGHIPLQQEYIVKQIANNLRIANSIPL